jgi:putative Holliday junction resolvase
VDPGQKKIGLAVSDPTRTIASPLTVLRHVSMAVDAARIAQTAEENHAQIIVVGQALGSEGDATPSSRHAQKLAEMIRSQTEIPVVLWDESGSTRIARQARIEMGLTRERRSGHMDEMAAVVILQTYLDERNR